MISISPSRSPSGLRDHSRHPSGDTASAMQGSVSGQSAGPSGSLDDPMYSLRAAALMTLKSKRRKPANSVEQTVSLSTRPAHVHPDIQLDYGDEASSAVNGSRTPIASTNEGPITAPDQGRSTDAMDIEEGQIREEGEISDTETPPPPQPYTTSPSKDLASSSKAPKAVAPPTLAARLGLKTSDAEHASTSAPVTASRTPASVSENILTGSWVLSPTPLSGFSLGDAAADISRAEIVRPGLALNAQQYETAKDIVLDLLGWGVPPEFLVSCGLSREIVFYVFSDLNLRLPANLDTTGLIPDASHEGQTFAPISTLAETQISLLGLPTNDNRHPSSSHHNLPPKPAASQFGLPSKPLPGSSSAPELGSVDSSPVITPATSVNGTNLHDIEQLRRQELLARKAVQASRKAKHPSLDIETAVASARPSSIVTALSDVEMSMPVPDETVDDFLKSIGPTSSVLPGLEIGRESLGQGRSTSRDDMDVDTPVLKVPQHTSQGNRPLSAQSAGMSLSPVTPSEIAVSSSGGPPSSTASTFSSMLSNGDVDTMTELEPRASVLPPTLRRGTKRPVAADFVDMEPGPSRPHPLSISSFARSTLSATRKPGSFASVSGMRRCVIDLSDSEEEEDESNDVSRREQGSFSPMPSSARASGTVSTRTITPPGSNVPPDLLEKEREIQRMRELIAQKEQRRHRKLAETSRPFSALSSPSTPHPFSTQGAPSDVSSASNLKVDDDEASAAALALHRTGRMSAYLLNGDNETADEDSVMRDLTAESQVPDDPTSVTSLTPEAVTPIDSASNSVEDATSGVEEAWQEQAVTSKHHSLQRVRVDSISGTQTYPPKSPTSSTQNLADSSSTFTEYVSILDRYPLLRLSSCNSLQHPSSCSTSISSSSSPGVHPISSLTIPSLPNLKPLKRAVASKALFSLPDWSEKRICQFEIPGGGECRDASCEDVHLSRVEGVGVEPTDEETAQYLHGSLPEALQPSLQMQEIKTALENVRWRGSNEKATIPFEERVAEAWALLGSARR